MSDAYDMIDRFLRNNLGSDDDYAEYSKALDSLCRAQPAQAGQVLTLDEVRESVYEAGLDWHNGWTMGEDAENRYLNLCRAIEQAVLAKRVPMTDEQIDESMRAKFYPARNRAFVDGVEAAERHHGIFGEKGGA